MSEVAERASATPESLSADEEALIRQVKSKFDRDDLILPQVRLCNALSKAVSDGDARAGEFVNTLTGENYGSSFPLVIVDYFKGRFYAPKDEDGTYVAIGDVAPDSWPDKYAGKHFVDIPDAEEQFKALANDPNSGVEWGDGPPIRTTYNYVGFLADPNVAEVPVRLSLQRTSVPTARKINTLIDLARSPWDKVFEVRSLEDQNSKGQKYYKVDVKVGDLTTPEQRSIAVRLGTQLQAASVQLHGDDTSDGATPKAEKPKTPKGAVEV